MATPSEPSRLVLLIISDPSSSCVRPEKQTRSAHWSRRAVAGSGPTWTRDVELDERILWVTCSESTLVSFSVAVGHIPQNRVPVVGACGPALMSLVGFFTCQRVNQPVYSLYKRQALNGREQLIPEQQLV